MKRYIGLLLPRSVIYPSIAFDIVDGFRTSYENSSPGNIEIKTININVANNFDEVYAKCEELLIAGAEIVVAYLNPMVADKLQPLFAAANKILIILDAGYNCVNTSHLPNIFFVSLQGVLCYRLIASIMKHNGHNTIAYTTSYFDAGYGGAYAFDCALKEAGSSITMHHITKLNRREFSLEQLLQHLVVNKNDAVLASFCGDMLLDFCTHAAQDTLAEKTAIYLAPFAAEEQWLSQSPYCGKDIDTCISWGSELQHEENKKFIAALAAKDRKANVFSLLGWEAAMLAASVFKHNNTASAISELEHYSYESPRGKVVIDRDFHQTNAPVYHARIVRATDNTCSLSILSEMNGIDEERKKLKEDIIRLNGQGSYWYNAYACLES